MPLPTAKSRAIGARISQVRCDAGLSTTEFAHQLGLWSRTMLQYESGVKRVPRYVIVAIAYLFACNEQWLLTCISYDFI